MQFHLLSFEGPDAYARAGGIASRVDGLACALADIGFETHLWFVGDPDLPGYEQRGQLHLHRWCQWISQYHRGGVYDGEEGKLSDYSASLPPYLLHEHLLDRLRAGESAVVLAEEWHTAPAVLHLDWLLRREGVRDRATLFWNANNTFGFDRIDWGALSKAATITTVSRYMKHLMWNHRVDAVVIPNGLSTDAFEPPHREALRQLRARFRDRALITKVARWDPDKRWLMAIEITRELKRRGNRPLLVARGGMEEHGHEVLSAAAAAGLRVVERSPRPGPVGLSEALSGAENADVIDLRAPIDPEGRRTLFRAADAVLANSGREPFGLVGLEAMAAGGIACTGCSGEEYAVSGRNALVLQTSDPMEFVGLFNRLKRQAVQEKAMRRAGRSTARHYAWPEIVARVLLPRVHLTAGEDVALDSQLLRAGLTRPHDEPPSAEPGETTAAPRFRIVRGGDARRTDEAVA